MSDLMNAIIAAKLMGNGGGGGGGGLPPITANDKGKVLTVEETAPTAVVFIPEQTLATGENVELVGVVEPELFYSSMKGTIHASMSGQTRETEAALYYSADGWHVDVQDLPFAYLYEGKWYVTNVPEEATISMTLDVPQISSYTEVFPSQSIEVIDGEAVLQESAPSWFKEGTVIRVTIDNQQYYSGIAFSFGQAQAIIPFGIEGSAFVIDGDELIFVSYDGTYTIKIEVCNAPLIADWAFSQSGTAGITPNGEISITSNGLMYGASFDVYGIFAHHKSGDIEYEQGTHTFGGPIITNEFYSLAVPTVGEGETEHIDCYFSIASITYNMASVISVSSDMATFTRMKNQNNTNANVWHCVSANGVKTGQISVQFAVS